MALENICPPAILYIAFSVTHIIIDTIKGLYNTALIKFVVMAVFTLLLNILCQMGISFVAWFIVFIPFIMMTIISSLLLFTFGLSPSSGKLNYNVAYPHGRHKHHGYNSDDDGGGRGDNRHPNGHSRRHHDNNNGKHVEWHRGYKYKTDDRNKKNIRHHDNNYYNRHRHNDR